MESKILTDARPVRMLAISCCRSVSDFSIRPLAWFSTSRTFAKELLAAGSGFISLVDESSGRRPQRHTHYISANIQTEIDDREAVIPAHRHRRGIHHL